MLTRIALRNVIVHWRQSLAAVLSISGAFFCFVSFQGYMLNVSTLYGEYSRSRLMYGDVLFENREAHSVQGRRDAWKYSLHAEDQNLLQGIFSKHQDQIAQTARHLYFQGIITNGAASKVFIGRASNLAEGSVMRDRWDWNATYGQPLAQAGFSHPILLGQTLGLQMGCEPEKKVRALRRGGGYVPESRPFKCLRDDVQLSLNTTTGRLNAMDFTVSGLTDGLYKDLDARYIEIPLEDAQELTNSKDITFWAVKLKRGTSIERWIQTLNEEISQKAPHLHAITWKKHAVGDLYRKSMSLLNLFGMFVSIVVAFISLLSVMNTMVKIVSERTKEIGTLLSMGFHRQQILRLFLEEAMYLGLVGSFLGALAAVLASVVVNRLQIDYKAGLFAEPVPFGILISPSTYLISMVVLLLVTLFTCYIACRSTVRKKIVECLGFV